MKVLIIIASILLTQALAQSCLDPAGCQYDYIVVGGGFGGIGFTYYANLAKRLSQETGVAITNIDLSKVLVLEQNSVLGGNARAVPAESVNQQAYNYAAQLYNLNTSNPYYVDVGGQRTAQLTLPLDRATAIDSQTTQEYVPWKTFEASRGRRQECPTANFSDYSTDNPWGISGSCTSDSKVFIGKDTNTGWIYGDGTIGPAYNLSGIQNWAYDESVVNTAVNWMLYGQYNGYPHPYRCPDQSKNCNSCGGCFAANNYVNLYEAITSELNYEMADLIALDFMGFYADWKKATIDPFGYIYGYNYRDWNTNAIYGYNVNSSLQYVYNIAKPILGQGVVRVNRKVTKLDTAGGGSSVLVTAVDTKTGQQYVYQANKKLIYAAPPDPILKGDITGTLAAQLKAQPQFNSLLTISSLDLTVSLKSEFWTKLVPKVSVNGSKWAVIRAVGEQGHLSRVEIRRTVAGDSAIEFRAAYTDYVGQEELVKFIGREDYFKQEIWDFVRKDLAYFFKLDIKDIPDVSSVVKLRIDYFDNAWHYINGSYPSGPRVNGGGSPRFTPQDLVNFAANPLPNNLVCLAADAWTVEYAGWKEGSFRTAVNCLGGISPASKDLIDCWVYQTFPECPAGVDCYSDSSVHLTGSQTLIPSRYCTERWWVNDFNQTAGCVNGVSLTGVSLKQCYKAFEAHYMDFKMNPDKYPIGFNSPIDGEGVF